MVEVMKSAVTPFSKRMSTWPKSSLVTECHTRFWKLPVTWVILAGTRLRIQSMKCAPQSYMTPPLMALSERHQKPGWP
jgi:hypothetical protein